MSYFFDDIKPYDNRDMSSSEDETPSNESYNSKKTSHFDQYSRDEEEKNVQNNNDSEEELLPVRDHERSESEDFESEPENIDKTLKKTSFKKLKNMQDDFDQENKRNSKEKKSNKLKASNETLEDIKQQLLLHKQSLNKLKQNGIKKQSKYDIPDEFNQSDSGSDIGGTGGFFEEEDEDSDAAPEEQNMNNKKRKKSKHAPKEEKLSKKISFVRNIPGLEDHDMKERAKAKAKENDIRFDKALGDNNIDYHAIRANYKFLDEYREQEIQRMRQLLKNKKEMAKLDDDQIEEIRRSLQKMENKMYTLKQKDKEHEYLKNYQREINIKNQNRNDGNKFYLKESDKRKLLNKFKFDNMDARQRNKVIERKRKRVLGKEMRMFGK
ncbi:uncharacterized protein HGUI_03229 [Hanseniaspora guilliermondii]|uniref:rRNA biogenesis protein RRP36 n=1 Tax=Hanseniaspora guilliermondii TaxID=56406 RepID=A0A1L0CPX2_9ASCO|nr:uncharacterized protein HGUI_03229 [Hanseniaspora guilliermondii]